MTTRVLIVDDSAVARQALRVALTADRGLRVVGEAATGVEALQLIDELRPDIVTMDVFLRAENGIDVAAAIMSRCPVPILVVTAKNPSEPGLLYSALEAGALDVWAKPPPRRSAHYEEQRARLVRVIKALARVPVVRRFRRRPASAGQRPSPVQSPADAELRDAGRIAAILIGASTGGPPVLARILRDLRAPFEIPIVIVQHMAPGFGPGFVEWLSDVSGHRVRIVERATTLSPGAVVLAPPERHLVFRGLHLVAPLDDVRRDYQRPSINTLFESAARHLGSRAIAVVLTGMGRDGADGLAMLKSAGAVTMVQSPPSCAVSSMPVSALAAGGVGHSVEPGAIAERLRLIISRQGVDAGAGREERI